MGEDQKPKESVALLDVLTKLDKNTPEGGIKPSWAWEYRQEVMGKYCLPENDYRWRDPIRYIEEIEKIATENGIEIRPRHEFQQFFEENPSAASVSFSENAFRGDTIVTSPLRGEEEWFQLRAKSNQLAHEIVHALQSKRYPRMPLREQEREAYYYQMLGDDFFLRYVDDPITVYERINGTIEQCIENSVRSDEKLAGGSK